VRLRIVFLDLVPACSRGYCQCVIITAALAGLVVFIAVCLGLTARLVYLGNLEALALAEKTAMPEPASALDWPDLHVRAVVTAPDDQSLIMLDVYWPAHPGQAATLLVGLDRGDGQALAVLARWCAGDAAVCPARGTGTELELRRRQSLERVRASLIAEDAAPAA
jgi:hypothetical protein